MKLESITQSAPSCFLALAISITMFGAAFGQDQSAGAGQNTTGNNQTKTQPQMQPKTQPKMSKGDANRPDYDNRLIGTMTDDEQQSMKAAQMIRETIRVYGKGIPQNIFDRAECVAAFTNVHTTGSMVRGRGLVSCRTGSGWSAPVYLLMHGDNLGSQMGAKSNDMVMMFMNRESLNSMMMNGKMTIGADAPAAAGPVGQDTGASTDAVMNAQILCYLRNKGMLAGAMFDGAMIEMDDADMRDVYGANFNCKEIMEGAKTKANSNSKIMAFSETLSRHASRQAKK